MTAEQLQTARELHARLTDTQQTEDMAHRQSNDRETIRWFANNQERFTEDERLKIADFIRAMTRLNRANAFRAFSEFSAP